jgi:hypothetical protein
MKSTARGSIARFSVACLVASLLLAAPGWASAPVESQRFFLPVDVSSGVAFGRGEPRPYALRVRATPAIGFGESGQVRLGAQVVGVYENPLWVAGAGPSVSVRIWGSSLKEIGVLAVLDHLWWQGDRPSSGAAVVLDLDGMFRIGMRVDRDWLEESTIPQITLGADVPTLLKLLGRQRSGAPNLPSD